MTKKTTWIGEADPEDKGSFCDRESGSEYIHGNITDAVQHEQAALERGEEVVWWDAPIDGSIDYEVKPGQQFDIIRLESDSQGVSRPPKFGPGK